VSIYPTSRSQRVKSARRLAQSKSCRTLDWPNYKRSVLDCGSPLPLFHTRALPLGGGLKFIRYLHAVNLEAIDGLNHRRRSRTFEPSRRTPWILICYEHQRMFHGILVNVVQARQIRFLVSEPRLAKIEPDLPTGSVIKFVDPPGSLHMKHAQRVGKIRSIVCFRRGVRDEMVMVRENGPSFQLPAEIARNGQQTAMQYPQAVRATEVMSPLIGAGGNEVSSTHRKLMRGCVRPRRAGLWHAESMTKAHARVESNERAAEDCRSPKAGAPSDTFGKREASWTAPVLWRSCTERTTSKAPTARPN
jgi:hypothetical protein